MKIKDECISLTNYAVETRYPFHKFDLEEQDVKAAVESMNKCNNLMIDILDKYIKDNENIEEDNTDIK